MKNSVKAIGKSFKVFKKLRTTHNVRMMPKTINPFSMKFSTSEKSENTIGTYLIATSSGIICATFLNTLLLTIKSSKFDFDFLASLEKTPSRILRTIKSIIKTTILRLWFMEWVNGQILK